MPQVSQTFTWSEWGRGLRGVRDVWREYALHLNHEPSNEIKDVYFEWYVRKGREKKEIRW